MKLVPIAFCILSVTPCFAQDDRSKVERACLDYVEAFYEADTAKWSRSVRPSLFKYGFWKSNGSKSFDKEGPMTFKDGIKYINMDRREKRFAKPGSIKEVEVMDVLNVTAVAKVKAYWGTDFLLLSKRGSKWMVESVIYESP